MLLHLVCLVPILLLVIFGYVNGRSANDNPVPSTSSNDSEIAIPMESSLPSTPTLADEKDGVAVTVELEQSAPDSASFIIDLNNHAYDLSSMDIGGLSHLNNVASSSYELIDAQAGGHHSKVSITFPT